MHLSRATNIMCAAAMLLSFACLVAYPCVLLTRSQAACAYYLRGLNHLAEKGIEFSQAERKSINGAMAVLYAFGSASLPCFASHGLVSRLTRAQVSEPQRV